MKVLQRSKRDKVFLGVCGGLGEYFSVDPIWFRLAFVVLALGSHGSGLVLYVLAAILIPEDPNEKESEKNVVEKLADEAEEKVGEEIRRADKECRNKRSSSQVVLGFAFIVVGLSILLKDVFNVNLSQFWPVILIVLGMAILVRK